MCHVTDEPRTRSHVSAPRSPARHAPAAGTRHAAPRLGTARTGRTSSTTSQHVGVPGLSRLSRGGGAPVAVGPLQSACLRLLPASACRAGHTLRSLEELHPDRREVKRKDARLAGIEETKLDVRLSVAHTAEGEQQAGAVLVVCGSCITDDENCGHARRGHC